MPPTARPNKDSALRKEAADRAARIAAMLDRWAAEDVSGEPDWNVEDVERIALRSAAGAAVDKPAT